MFAAPKDENLQERLFRKAKTIRLKNNLAAKEKRNNHSKIFQDDISFLTVEDSVAIYTQLKSAHILSARPYNHYQQYIVEAKFEECLRSVELAIQKLDKCAVYGFAYDWEITGAMVLEIHQLINLNKTLFHLNDELSVFNADLNKAILFTGDRTGSWDKLNELSISVLGQDWQNSFEDTLKL